MSGWSWYLANKNDVVPLLAPLASLLTGLLTVFVAGFAAWIALREAKIARQQAETARLRHEEQTNADRQRRITESFTKAVEQLGSKEPPVRLGGIYALERLSRESALDYWPIMEILTGFVRDWAPWKDADMTPPRKVSRVYEDVSNPHQTTHGVPTDIAAVLTVIKCSSRHLI